MPALLMRPILTLNGTDAYSLVEARVAAREAARKFMQALEETAPNGRDYIGQPDAYQRDLAIYRARFLIMDELYNSLGEEALDIQNRTA